MSAARGLAAVSTADLERLLAAVDRGRLPLPLSGAGLASQKLGHLAAALGGLVPLDLAGVRAVLEAVLAERAAHAPVRAELVWTGPEGKAGWASSTPHVLADLFGRAQRSMLVAGYAFDHGTEILAPMHEAMKARGVTVDLFMNIREAPEREVDTEAFARGEVTKFFTEQWPWEPRPGVYYDPRTVRAGGPRHAREHASLHAKCVVVDERWSLVGSANFTDRGQTRNIEVGALLDDPSFAQALLRQFRGVAAAGVFVHWLG
jgi:phosphatidylserine/phosphatidylglycerophosphate/cardiolipin synthase-like enzyme